MSWWDPAAECAVTIAEPAAAPDLFAEYHRGAVASYAKFGVSDALDADTARCADDTALFWVMTDVDGRRHRRGQDEGRADRTRGLARRRRVAGPAGGVRRPQHARANASPPASSR